MADHLTLEWKTRAKEYEAELDAARPLIEAVMKLEQVDFDAADDHGLLTTEAEALFDAALAYRERKDREAKL